MYIYMYIWILVLLLDICWTQQRIIINVATFTEAENILPKRSKESDKGITFPVALTNYSNCILCDPWWRHQLETFSALLAICAGNSPIPGEFPAQRPVMRSFDAFFDLRPNKRLSKQSWGWWFETPSRPLWRHRNAKSHPVSLKALWHDVLILPIHCLHVTWRNHHSSWYQVFLW